MSNVLEIHAVEMVKAVGFFKFDKSPLNERWCLNLPSVECTFFAEDSEAIEQILQKVLDSTVGFDYVTVHDGQYSNTAWLSLVEFFNDFLSKNECRINLPGHFVAGGGIREN